MNMAIARRRPKAIPPKIVEVRPMVAADLEYLREPSARTRITRIRNIHHHIARLAASGITYTEIAAKLGYTRTRISVLLADPSMQELVAGYTAEVHESWREHVDTFHELAVANMTAAERMISERLEDADEGEAPTPSIRELLAITADRMDRFGYGKKQTNVNVNIDFAKRLEAAISRSRRVES